LKSPYLIRIWKSDRIMIWGGNITERKSIRKSGSRSGKAKRFRAKPYPAMAPTRVMMSTAVPATMALLRK
jgi:hypothetical protein